MRQAQATGAANSHSRCPVHPRTYAVTAGVTDQCPPRPEGLWVDVWQVDRAAEGLGARAAADSFGQVRSEVERGHRAALSMARIDKKDTSTGAALP